MGLGGLAQRGVPRLKAVGPLPPAPSSDPKISALATGGRGNPTTGVTQAWERTV